jgi:hypothetical protein
MYVCSVVGRGAEYKLVSKLYVAAVAQNVFFSLKSYTVMMNKLHSCRDDSN